MINAVNSIPSNNQPQGIPVSSGPIPMTSSPTPTSTPSSFPTPSPIPQYSDLRESGSFAQATGGSSTPPPTALKKNKNLSKVLGLVVLLVLVLGGGAGLFLLNLNQDTRQQASSGSSTPTCGSVCKTDLQCPSGNICDNNRCILRACASNPGSCTSNKCSLGEDVENRGSAACTLTFNPTTTTNPSIGVRCEKVAYQDELSNSAGNYTLTTPKAIFGPSDVIVYKVTLTNTGTATQVISLSDILVGTTSNNLRKVSFLDSNCGPNAFKPTALTLSCPIPDVAAGASVSRIFRVKVASDVTDGLIITNTAGAATGSTTATCQVAVTISKSSDTTYTCNSTCTTDAQCKTANANYTCSGNKCRLETNTSSTTCSPAGTPTFACNSTCTTDAQCQTVNASYTCSVENGNKCRLDSNRTSDSCSAPTNTYSCNSACSSDDQCKRANSNYVCNSNKCRLDGNTGAENCQPTIPPVITPTVGCNQSCASNSDCAASNQVCVQTEVGQRCRLENYVNSETCTTPGTTSTPPITKVITQTDTTTTQQPERPAELPRSGAVDTTVRFLLIGAGAVILGGLGLLLL